ncbi:MAG: hypothetical protein KBA46_01035, partial [Candidatus Omnitrophica bacterium]|nr:hypothetical protein [Candidatus Omnitrophota bacterium]
MVTVLLLFIVPLLAGVVMLALKQKKHKVYCALAVFLVALGWSIYMFFRPASGVAVNFLGNYYLMCGLTVFSSVIAVFVNFFGLITCLYSKDYMEDKGGYFSCLVWLVGFSNLAVLSLDFITFIFAWGSTLVLLYALLSLGSGASARKALSVLGLADFALMLGICLYIAATGTTVMPQWSGVVLDTPLLWCSFIFMLIGALAKAGCGPFHSWIPTAAESAPIPVMAILPASLDKLLGIYFLARICVDFFVMNHATMVILLVIGSLTILFAVLLALIQHDLRKLLSFHAISQVGYMVLGFGTGTPLGIAGGIFHMVNHALYKTGLFLTGGAAAAQKNTFELNRLGNLARYMPLTFSAGLVFSLSISGVPPFNGFASKWLLYQGTLVGMFNTSSLGLRSVFIFALVSAMVGSALTLASFIKFIHAIFLGQEKKQSKQKIVELKGAMLFALLVLAALCIILGIIPRVFLSYCISPYLGQTITTVGNWSSVFAALFIGIGVLAGVWLWLRS